MRYLIRMAALPVILLLCSNTVLAAKPAHCFADVTITDGTITHNNKIWDRRTNGNRWHQWDGSHRAECDSLGANHFNSIDLAAFAKAQGMCGTIQASGSSWIGTSNKKGTLGPKTISVPCESETGNGYSKISADFQYSAKVVCGRFDNTLTKQGDYKAVVNIHNPGYETVDLRYKFASAGPAKDGDISRFTDTQIGPDGAQYFSCGEIAEFADLGSDFDGFLVVESREPLDVVTYYTGGAKEAVTSLDVETVRERLLPDNRRWNCGTSRSALWRAPGWTVNGNPAVGVTHFDDTPIFSDSHYGHDGIDGWFSTQAVLTDTQKGGDYTYKMPFCLCSDREYPTQALINVSALRGDNSVNASIDGAAPFIPGPNVFGPSTPAGTGSATITGEGQHFLELNAHNAGDSYHAVGIGGVIGLQNGYLGLCEE